jgi:hypothetical protein
MVTMQASSPGEHRIGLGGILANLVRCFSVQLYPARLSKGHASAWAQRNVPSLFIRATSKW